MELKVQDVLKMNQLPYFMGMLSALTSGSYFQASSSVFANVIDCIFLAVKSVKIVELHSVSGVLGLSQICFLKH